MSYREHLPTPALAPFVDRFWTRTGSGRADRADRAADLAEAPSWILPDGCIDVILRVDRGVEARVVGAMRRAELIPALGEAQIAAVRLRPGGAAAIFQLSAAELTDRSEPLDALGPCGPALRSELERGAEIAARLGRQELLHRSERSSGKRAPGPTLSRADRVDPPLRRGPRARPRCSRPSTSSSAGSWDASPR